MGERTASVGSPFSLSACMTRVRLLHAVLRTKPHSLCIADNTPCPDALDAQCNGYTCRHSALGHESIRRKNESLEAQLAEAQIQPA